MSPSLPDRAEREIHARHAFFVDWFAGRADDAAFDRAAAAFRPDFVRVPPEGNVQDRDAVLAMIRGARGAIPDGFAIAVEMEAGDTLSEGLVLVRYVERQQTPTGNTARRSSALFVEDASAPEGVAWRYLQETWMDQDIA